MLLRTMLFVLDTFGPVNAVRLFRILLFALKCLADLLAKWCRDSLPRPRVSLCVLSQTFDWVICRHRSESTLSQ
jgi:hypothetical protein